MAEIESFGDMPKSLEEALRPIKSYICGKCSIHTGVLNHRTYIPDRGIIYYYYQIEDAIHDIAYHMMKRQRSNSQEICQSSTSALSTTHRLQRRKHSIGKCERPAGQRANLRYEVFKPMGLPSIVQWALYFEIFCPIFLGKIDLSDNSCTSTDI